MSILIADRPVRVGDKLYHVGFESWGTVTRYDPSGSAELSMKGRGGIRKVLVQNNGIVTGRRMVYWHEPLRIDMPFQNVSSMQRVIDVLAKELITRD